MTYKLFLTKQGADKVAHAHATSSTLAISHFAVGQGESVDFSARLNEQSLVAPCYRGQTAGAYKLSSNQYEILCVIPPDVGGFTVREFGLFDSDGVLIWVGNIPETYKPEIASLSAVDFRIKAVVQVDNPQVQIVLDGNTVTATRTWVDNHFIPKSALELLYPIGYKYWSHKNENPAAAFSALFGYETHWRRLEGVHLLAVKEGTKASKPMYTFDGVATDNNAVLDLAYTSYLFERYDPSALPVMYDGTHYYNGNSQYQE